MSRQPHQRCTPRPSSLRLIPLGVLACSPVCLVAVVEGRLRGHGDADLTPLEIHSVEPPESGVGRGRLFVLDDAVALGLSGGVVLVDPHGERPLVLVAPLLLGNSKCDNPSKHARTPEAIVGTYIRRTRGKEGG